jgi:hypothetical protein
MLYNFFDALNITAVPREANHRADNLAKSAVDFKLLNLDHRAGI